MNTPVPRRSRRPWAASAAPLLLLALMIPTACITPARHRVDVYLSEPTALRSASWEVGVVEVDHRSLAEQIRAQLGDMLLPAFHGRGLPLEEGSTGGPGFLIDLRIVEREIARDLDALNALSLTLVVREKATGRRAATVLYSEESRETFASPYHLHAVLDAVLEALEKETGQRDGKPAGQRAGQS